MEPVIIRALLLALLMPFAPKSSAVCVAAGDEMEITLNGAAAATIVKPAAATPRETFAAEALQRYLKAISGATLPIRDDASMPTGKLILIGGPERNALTAGFISPAEFDASVPGPEGMLIKTFGSSILVLAGSSKNPFEYERGTLYAVYEFLEAYLGCSFGAYGAPGARMGEFVPVAATVRVGPLDHRKAKADNPYRTAIVQYYNTTIPPTHGLNGDFIDWLGKTRYNRILTMESIYTAYKGNGMLAEAQKRGIQFTVGHHESSLLFLPPDGNDLAAEKYFITHPEYYKLQSDGKRFHATTKWTDQWIFCSRNKPGQQHFAANANEWLRRNPYVDAICIWPNDATAPQCQDSLCKPFSKVENYTHFVNQVAIAVSKSNPNVKIDLLAYEDLYDCPAGLKLDSSVVVDVSTWSDAGLRTVGKKDGGSLLGTAYELSAKKWRATGAKVVYYEYFMGNFGAGQKYVPMADEMQPVFKYFKTSGLYQGSGTQVEPFNVWNCLFNFYAHARTSYDNDLTVPNLLARFGRIFGAGAPFVAAYLQYVESVLEGQATYDQAGTYLALNADKKKVYAWFDSAFAAEPEGVLRNNLRMLRMAFRYSDLSTNRGADAELRYLYDHFDSYKHDPGYGIFISLNGAAGAYTPDKWYAFSPPPLASARPPFRRISGGARLERGSGRMQVRIPGPEGLPGEARILRLPDARR